MRLFTSRQVAWWLILSTLIWGALPARAQGVPADADFEPPILSIGQAGTYTITLKNVSEIPSIPPPSAEGLIFSDSPSVSRRQSWINGVSSRELGLSWRFAAQREGTFTVPARSLRIGGDTLQIPAARVRVVPMSERERGLFKLKWDLPEKTFYVGEAIPAFLKVYVREGVDARIPALPEKQGDGFLQTPFTDQVTQARETIDGIDYRVFIWSVVLTPIRAGELTLEASIPVVYADPYTTRFGTDAFGFRRVREQQRRLTTGELSFTIKEPPAEGRPASFNGALGKFEVAVELGRDTVQAGEPVTLKMMLSGTGNFDRISAPTVPDSDLWRVYPPKVTFSGESELGLNGTKTFEYLLIPTSKEATKTPKIPFAAFDPYSETYEDLSVEPQPITVTPAPAPSAAPTVYADSDPAEESSSAATWRPNRAALGSVKDAIRPIFLTRGFWLAQGGIGLAFLLVFAWRKRRDRLAHDESYARRVVGSRSVRAWSRKATEAAGRGEAEAFYSAAQRALQESAGRHFPRGRKAESLTLVEIEDTLRHHGVPESCRASVAHLFQTGDALKYARSSFPADQLRADADRLVEALRELHKELA